jgi:hypothetical protein
MRKIQDAVRDIVMTDEEALYALAKGYMNLSAYSKLIRSKVEEATMKDVENTGIVVALSRLQRELDSVHPLIEDVPIKNITSKSPVCEIVFEKTRPILKALSSFYADVKTGNDDFLTMTLSTSDVTIICSERLQKEVLEHFKEKPLLKTRGLAALGLTFDPRYYNVPNVGYSLLRRIAKKRILLAEVLSTHNELIFVFDQKRLAEVVSLFQAAE